MWNKNFILLLQGGAVSYLGDVLYTAAIGYWILQKTGSTAVMGIMSSISMFMVLFVMPFSGSVADKSDRKKLIVAMDARRGVVMLATGLLAYSDRLSVPAVLAITVIMALCNVFFDPAASTAFIDIIPPQRFIRGQSLKSSVYNMAAITGQGISGLVITAIGVPFTIVANGVSFLASAFTELFITLPPRSVQQGRHTPLADMKQGITAVMTTPALKVIVISCIAINTLSSGSGRMMMAFCLQQGLSVEQYGAVMSLGSAAAVISGVMLSAVNLKPQTKHRIMSAGFISACLFSCMMCVFTGFAAVAVLYFVSVLANCLANAILTAAMMQAMPKDRRGTILGIVSAASTGAQAVSTLLYGFMGELLPLSVIYGACNLLALLPMTIQCTNRAVYRLITDNRNK